MSRALALCLIACTGLVPATASADVFKLFGEVHGGGMYGQGTAGQSQYDFFANSPHPTYGALIGGEFLFFDAWIQHHQYLDSSQLTTFTQFGLGIHFTIDTGDEKQQKAHKGGYIELGSGLWFGVSTNRQIHPPLDKSQVNDQAFLLEGRLGAGWHLSSIFDFGLVVPVSYGFFFLSNGGMSQANSTSNQYRGWEIEGLLALRANIRLF